MMKGLVSFDALIAIMLLTFMVIWLQDFAAAGLDNADSFGSALQLKASAMSAGSEMNAFYALSPKTGDFVELYGGALRSFGGNASQITLSKGSGDSSVTASIGAGSQAYPTAGAYSYALATGRYGP
jgi:hypothetical protein